MADFKRKTVHVTLRGKVKWAKTHTPNKFGKYSVDLYPDDASRAKMQALKEAPGIKNTWKKDDDGEYMTFGREAQKLINGKMVTFAAPIVLKADDTPLTDKLIGNGSDCDIILEVYGFGGKNNIAPSRAARLDSVKVHNLVPYEIKKDFTEEEQDRVRGLLEQPPMPSW